MLAFTYQYYLADSLFWDLDWLPLQLSQVETRRKRPAPYELVEVVLLVEVVVESHPFGSMRMTGPSSRSHSTYSAAPN